MRARRCACRRHARAEEVVELRGLLRALRIRKWASFRARHGRSATPDGGSNAAAWSSPTPDRRSEAAKSATVANTMQGLVPTTLWPYPTASAFEHDPHAAMARLPLKIMEINIHAPHLPATEDDLRKEVMGSLRRHTEHLTRVDVFVKDQNGEKGGRDKRCTIEARPRGLDPVVAEVDGMTASEAVIGAAKKLQRQLDTLLGKRADHHRG
jgi:ribosome-associated translation inhibitor RaiA